MKKHHSLQDKVGFLLGFTGGVFAGLTCLGLGLMARDVPTFILPAMVIVLVCSVIPGAIAKTRPVLLWGIFLFGYAPLQVLLGAGLISEGSSVGVWGITHLTVLLLAALGIWTGRALGYWVGGWFKNAPAREQTNENDPI
jgi:hypothetical protein